MKTRGNNFKQSSHEILFNYTCPKNNRLCFRVVEQSAMLRKAPKMAESQENLKSYN